MYLALIGCCFILSYSYYLLIYVIVYSLLNYYFGLIIALSRFKKTLFRVGIVLNLVQLVLLRYASFTIDPIFQVLKSDWTASRISEIIIPVGVSFFTLQGIGYLINIYRGWEKPEKSFLHFFIYISFYLKFLSGPIERSNHFLPQLKGTLTFNEQRVADGIRIAILGVFKKVAIANQLAPFIHNNYSNLDSADGFSLWLILILQPLYLYFDFSGYTDIARGFSKAIGIDLVPNFKRPFLSGNMTTFWKRFHVSLSSWFHDYLYLSTGFAFRRWGIYASVYAVFITWILFGIWHGAGWNFMILGLLQALAINYEYFTKKWRTNVFSNIPGYLSVFLGRIFTYFFYCISLVLFFAPDTHSVFLFFSKLSDINSTTLAYINIYIFYLILIFMITFIALEIIEEDFKNLYRRIEAYWLSNRVKCKILRWAFYIVIITFIFVISNEVQQFIYFQF